EVLGSHRFLNGAHRGASAYAPENTLPAFELAVTQGAAALEIDVRLTRDAEVVVFHDARVDRTTDGHGEVRLMTLAELRALDAGRWFGDTWHGTRIPTLREVLEQFAGRVVIDVDMKAGTALRSVAAETEPLHSAPIDPAGPIAKRARPRVVVEDPAV